MSRVKPERFVHVVYRTRRFDEMIRWYQKVFDAKVQFKSPLLAFLTYDDEHHRFAFANMSVADPGGTEIDKSGQIGVDHVAYTFGSLRALLECWEQLKNEGIEPYWCLHHGVTVSLYYADPDRNAMEFQVDSYPSVDATNEFMRGPGYSLNPVGVEFAPGEWLSRLRAGAPESDYLIRTKHEPIPALRLPANGGAN